MRNPATRGANTGLSNAAVAASVERITALRLPRQAVQRANRYAEAALACECAELSGVTTGRNDRINRAAYALGRFVGAEHLDRGCVEAALFNAATANGYVAKDGAAQAWATIRSGLSRGILNPRDPPVRGWDEEAAPPALDPETVARLELSRERRRVDHEAEVGARIESARRIWDAADPDPRVTIVERYLREHRELDLPPSVCGHAIRFHPACPWEGERVPTMLCAYRDLRTDEIVGLHRTRLDPVTAAKVGRMALGRSGGAAVKLTPDSEVAMGLHIAEGVETALAGMALGFAPMWAMGTVGGIKAFPVLSGIEALTVCAEEGQASADAVEEVGTRWTAAGREVRVCRSRFGSDLNDGLRKALRS